MNSLKYLACDGEMGGRDLKYTLLSAAFIVMDDQFGVIGQLDLKLKSDDGDYLVNGQGMGVNRIDIVSHDKIATPYKLAKSLLYNFLKEMSEEGKTKLTPLGHGILGDIHHFTKCLISEGSWEQFCTYHYIDTSVVLQFLRACGKMPMDCDGSVGALAEHFGVCLTEGTLHDAMVDAKLTAAIYQKMLELGKGVGAPE